MTIPGNTLKDLIDIINDDSSYSSRKFRIAVVGMLLIILGAVVAGNWPAFGSQYPSAVWGIVSIAVGYMGGNVAAKYVIGKTVGSIVSPDPAGAATVPPGGPPAAPVAIPVAVPVVSAEVPPPAPPGPPPPAPPPPPAGTP